MIRNLLYNCCPLDDSEEWRLNVERLNYYASIFNGRKIVLLKTGLGMVPPEVVKAAFTFEAEFRLVPNDPVLGEGAGFIDALRELQSLRSDEATFYAHTKGVSRWRDSLKKGNIRFWRNTMYRECLSDADRIDDVLSRYSCCGCLLNPDGHQPRVGLHNGVQSKWFFAGTFFWFRHDRLFSRSWEKLPNGYYGVEGYLGLHIPLSESYDLGEYPIKNWDLYHAWKHLSYVGEHQLVVSDRAKLVFLHNHKTAGRAITKALGSILSDLRYEHPFTYPTLPRVCLKEELELAGYGDYRSFGFVRNPWDRLVSWYAMCLNKPATESGACDFCEMRTLVVGRPPAPKLCRDCTAMAGVKNSLVGYQERFYQLRDGAPNLPKIKSATRPRFLWGAAQSKRVDAAVKRPPSFKDFVEQIVLGTPMARSQLDAYFSDRGGQIVTTEPVGRYENLQEDFSAILKRLGLPDVQLGLENTSKHKHYSEYYDDALKEKVAAAFARDIEEFGYVFEKVGG